MIEYLEKSRLPEDKQLAYLIQRNSHLYALDENKVLIKYKDKRLQNSKFRTQPGSTYVIMVPPSLRQDVLQAHHDNLGHQGEHRTRDAIALKYQWDKMAEDVKQFVQSCEKCQQASNTFKALTTYRHFRTMAYGHFRSNNRIRRL